MIADLARSILSRRAAGGAAGGQAARALLADVHLALGEVALESETYDKAVIDMREHPSSLFININLARKSAPGPQHAIGFAPLYTLNHSH